MPEDLTKRIMGLKTDVAKAQQLRATAEGSLTVARQQLAEAETKLRDLGLNPDNAEAELAAMEADLTSKVEAFKVAVEAEIMAYGKILEVARAALHQT